MLSVILLLDGYNTCREGAHKKLIEYIRLNYEELTEYDMSLIDNLRIIRNKISYDGFFVDKDYIPRKLSDIKSIIVKLKLIINNKL